MGRHYSTPDFFRQMPNWLLARYFQTRGVLGGLDFAAMEESETQELFEAWRQLPDSQRGPIEAELSEIHEMSCEKGWCSIRDEAAWRLREAPEKYEEFVTALAALANHYERAMATFLDYGDFWRAARLFYRAETLHYWRKRKGLPHRPASVHVDGRNALAESIREYFHRTEGRGNHCIVEALRRGDLDYFFAYPEDYSKQSIEWVEGKFNPRPHNPAFEVIYVYSERDGTLDLNFRGDKKAVEPLQAMFATSILKLSELPPEAKDERVYDLNPLRSREFDFVFGPASGIQSVVVKKLRFSSWVTKGDRITLEADADARPKAIYDLMDEVGKSARLDSYNVTQVELSATVIVDAEKPPKTVTVRITHPNFCSLKYDEMDSKLRKMLADSDIEPREPVRRLALDESETTEA